MSLLLALAIAGALLAFFFLSRRRGERATEPARESTPALDAWIRDALELELAEGVLGLSSSTPEERRRLARTLAHEPDADIVSRIEDKVRGVELEFVRYAHESDAEVTVRVRYEDGKTGTSTKRLPMSAVPEAVLADFAEKGSTRAFRAWVFPWQRVTTA